MGAHKMTHNALGAIVWPLFLIVSAGHFFERDMRGYAFDEVLGHAAGWFDKTLVPKK
jgi:hypothetical protein